ncbi:thioredoxin b [Anarrhichthys ocellatus]|uniref:thioredoxin b n=1 Tax=Anarrhichthys ocellatus TaxID=433405 RepID=UPI0012ED7DCC|nr:thioredoxin [Anarrhichthys ocellatus]
MANDILEPTNLAEFKQMLKDAGDKLVVVDFTATWCGPCKMIAPKFHALVSKPENKNVVFMKVDVDEADDVSRECKVTSMPTFHFYKNGKKVDEFSGANVEKLHATLEKWRT